MLEFSKTDLARLDTVMKALRRGKYELEGEEVLAFAQAFAYVSELFGRMKVAMEKPLPVPVEMDYTHTPAIESRPRKPVKKAKK